MFLSSSLIGSPASHVKNVKKCKKTHSDWNKMAKAVGYQFFQLYDALWVFKEAKHFLMLKIIFIYGQIKKTALSKKWFHSTWLLKGQKKS